MKRYLVRTAPGLFVLLLLLGHAAHFYRIGFIDRLDAFLYDTRVRLTLPRGIDERVVILDIDEKSLAEVGRWPWSRDKLAALVDKLFDRHGVALLGFDVVFAEPDDSSGLRTLDALAAGRLRGNGAFQAAYGEIRPRLDHDARFAGAIRGRPVILGYYLSGRAGAGTGTLPAPVLPAGTFQGRDVALTRWDSFGANLPDLQKSAAGAGHMNPVIDSDGVLRRVPMLAELDGRYYESLSLAMVRALLGFPRVVPGYPEAVFSSGGRSGMEWLDLPTERGTLRIPVDENAAALIPYRGPQGSFPYVSAADVLADRVGAERLKGKVVLVGATAPGLKDLRATPVDRAYPGVEIHANLIAGMLDAALPNRPSWGLGADVAQLLIAGAVMVFLLPRLSPLRAGIAALLVLLFLLLVNLVFWRAAHGVLPLASGLLMVALLAILNMAWSGTPARFQGKGEENGAK